MVKKILDKQVAKKESTLNVATSVTDVKLLVDKDGMEDVALLQTAFPNSVNSKVISLNAENENVVKLKELHKGDIFSIDEIKSICMKYRLKFLPSTKYKGVIPIELIHEMKRKFTKENGFSHLKDGSQLIYDRNLMILAPASQFEASDYHQNKREAIKRAKAMKRADPAAFVKVEGGYLFLKEWGNSFSPLRRVLGALTAKKQTLGVLFFLAWVSYIIANVFILRFLLHYGFEPKWYAVNILATIGFILYAIWAVVTTASWVCPADEGFFMAKFKSRDEGFWSIDKYFATEENWNSN